MSNQHHQSAQVVKDEFVEFFNSPDFDWDKVPSSNSDLQLKPVQLGTTWMPKDVSVEEEGGTKKSSKRKTTNNGSSMKGKKAKSSTSSASTSSTKAGPSKPSKTTKKSKKC